MFWGLNLKSNRKYSQTTSKSFHISQAALDTESGPGPARLFLTYENEKFLVCTLKKGECEQVMLDYNFAEGDEISFESKGNGNVALTGYVVTDAMDDYMNGDEEDSELEDIEVGDLRAALNKKKGKKEIVPEQQEDDDDEDDEDDEDFDGEQTELAQSGEEDDDEDEEDDDDDDEEDDDEEELEEGDEEDDDEDDEEEDEPVEQPKSKKQKLEKEVKQNGVAKGAEKDKKKKKEQQPQQAEKQGKQQQQAGVSKTISGGVKIDDIRVGNGPEAKQGKRAQVYYEGRLKSNNKVFDSSKQGAGFKFTVGRGEVIKAWDVGVVGMKVGGKRRITCPPHMAYGARGAPPSIPPNSTLVFEVELKGVN